MISKEKLIEHGCIVVFSLLPTKLYGSALIYIDGKTYRYGLNEEDFFYFVGETDAINGWHSLEFFHNLIVNIKNSVYFYMTPDEFMKSFGWRITF